MCYWIFNNRRKLQTLILEIDSTEQWLLLTLVAKESYYCLAIYVEFLIIVYWKLYCLEWFKRQNEEEYHSVSALTSSSNGMEWSCIKQSVWLKIGKRGRLMIFGPCRCCRGTLVSGKRRSSVKGWVVHLAWRMIDVLIAHSLRILQVICKKRQKFWQFISIRSWLEDCLNWNKVKFNLTLAVTVLCQ